MLEAAGGSIAYRFQARDVNLVLAPPADGGPVPFAVRSAAGRPATTMASTSTRPARGPSTSRGCISSSDGEEPSRPRTFEITFAGPGVHAYVFTFG